VLVRGDATGKTLPAGNPPTKDSTAPVLVEPIAIGQQLQAHALPQPSDRSGATQATAPYSCYRMTAFCVVASAS